MRILKDMPGSLPGFGAAAVGWAAAGLLGIAVLLTPAAAEAQQQAVAVGNGEETVRIALPPPDRGGETPLAAVLNARRSVRSFAAKGLQLAELGQLLWAGGGDSADSISGATRTAPSAGGLYPVELYVAVGEVRNLSSGIYRYVPGGHSVAKLIDGDRRRELASAALGQRWMAGAPAVVVITGDPGRVRGKYGERGVRRYMEIDAGMAAENLLLQAAALGLGGTPVGAFRDGSVSGLLGLQNREPLLIIPVGVPAE